MNATESQQRTSTPERRLEERLRSLGQAEPGDDFTAGVMARIGSVPVRVSPETPIRRIMLWFVSPRSIRLSPLGGLAVAAGLLLALGLLFRSGGMGEHRTPEGLTPVTFVLDAPGANEVAVIGSFNGWNAVGWSMRRDEVSGLWTLSASLPQGSHEYVFLVDGAATLTDNSADLSAADGFGSRNSVLMLKDDHGAML